jgi:hypothetical protein
MGIFKFRFQLLTLLARLSKPEALEALLSVETYMEITSWIKCHQLLLTTFGYLFINQALRMKQHWKVEARNDCTACSCI